MRRSCVELRALRSFCAQLRHFVTISAQLCATLCFAVREWLWRRSQLAENLELFNFWALTLTFLNQRSSRGHVLLEFYMPMKNIKTLFMRLFRKNLEYRIFSANSAQLRQNARSTLVLCTDASLYSHFGAVVCHTVFAMRCNCVTNLPQSIIWACRGCWSCSSWN